MSAEQGGVPEVKTGGFRREVIETVSTLAWALALMLVLRVGVFQPDTIPSSSMEPGLVTGDYIVVSKWSYGWSRASIPFNPPLPPGRIFGKDPARGDVVVSWRAGASVLKPWTWLNLDLGRFFQRVR